MTDCTLGSVSDASHVVARQAISEDQIVGSFLAVAGGLDAADDDVRRAKLLDLLHRLEACRLADGQHDDDRGHPQHDAQHRQK